MKNPRFSYIIRSLCGLYLFWIVWDLLKAFRSGEEVSVLMIVAAVAFVIFGALFLVTGVRGWMRVNKELQEEAEKMKEEEEKAEKDPRQERPGEPGRESGKRVKADPQKNRNVSQ